MHVSHTFPTINIIFQIGMRMLLVGGGVSKSMKFGRSVGVRNNKVKKGRSSKRKENYKYHWILDEGLPYIKSTGITNLFPKKFKD
jgi:predicted metal-dependent phosphotriesterase family hydrolase